MFKLLAAIPTQTCCHEGGLRLPKVETMMFLVLGARMGMGWSIMARLGGWMQLILLHQQHDFKKRLMHASMDMLHVSLCICINSMFTMAVSCSLGILNVYSCCRMVATFTAGAAQFWSWCPLWVYENNC